MEPFGKLAGIAALAMSIVTTTNALAADVCYRYPFPNPNVADGFGSLKNRAHPHRGVDFPQPAGTGIPVIADGVVVLRAKSGCLGNVVVVKHADGMFSGYSHMIAQSPLGTGTRVTKGKIIGRVGTTGVCSTGPHLHLTMSKSINGYAFGQVQDPLAYMKAHDKCSCDRGNGGVTFSCDGKNKGKTCVAITEPDDKDGWDNNYLCTDKDIGLEWSSDGPIEGMRCTNITEPSSKEAHSKSWSNNFVCLPSDSRLTLEWNSKGEIDKQDCFNWNEPKEKGNGWEDNNLCVSATTDFSSGIFTFSADGPVDDQTCVRLDEPKDAKKWKNNYFCSTVDIGMQWSSEGPIEGMTCTNINEPKDETPAVWADNYLCLPKDAPYIFSWSSNGEPKGQSCTRWYEADDLKGSWGDNYLCATPQNADSPPVPTGGNGNGDDGGGYTEDGQPDGFEEGCSTVPQPTSEGGSSDSSGLLTVAAGAIAVMVVRRRRAA